MKNLILLLAFFTCFCTRIGFSQTESVPAEDTLSFLQVEGKITNANLGADRQCRVELWSPAGMVDSLTLKCGKTKFSFMLLCNSYYTIRICKKGFVDRLICVNTSVPADQGESLFRFKFETGLIGVSQARSLNRDALDFPVAIVHYHENEEYFDYNKEYTAAIKEDLYVTDNNQTASK